MQPEMTAIAAQVCEALCLSLETMAFISPFPPDAPGPWACPVDMRRVSIEFMGPVSGLLDLAAPAAFGAMLASNALACEATDPEAARHAEDALSELMNVTCGTLLNAIGGEGHEMGIPQVEPLDAAEWEAFTATGQATVLDADGHLLASRVRALSTQTNQTLVMSGR